MRRKLLAVALGLGVAAAIALSIAHTQQPAPATKPPAGNVRDHGAKGDGTADDWQAIQNAVDVGAGVVSLPKGTYRITKPIVIDLDKVGFTSITGNTVARIVM